MPLDQVHVHIEDREITIAFSDCAHIAEVVKGYKTTFICVSGLVHAEIGTNMCLEI